MMQGISMNELYDVISNSHDVEFTYDGTMYVLQTEIDGENTFLVIWDCTPGSPKCIAKYCIPDQNTIPKSVIDNILDDPCFDGKSFMDIKQDVVVDIIY
ncbi:hypothetical protein [Pseudoramibacter sp.]|jgi:hypothetical protein|uniref:hypothetical protein n=1 Tax=Pseudoramibacter sp. TaxID=2034862 RepID=UPI0025CC5AF0|nr:hypothetical protein [Pseudoramibacter sp.]MCH4072455.1 hypothetical protein [Pseudoramibacter sp.]MCH4106226.1 hypothetical protein [Pseudoramibacter sp.]